ncbi:uncharacterized protein [Haliotis asinina]|uniref:uncharacterized protein n=1 Tax=Haliotis asinina TaxID=109174 RepID=UPI003531959F
MKPLLCVLLFLVAETGGRSRFDPNKVEVKAHAPVYETWNFKLDGAFASGLQQLSACRRDLRTLEKEVAHLQSRGQAEAGKTAASQECPEPPPLSNALVTMDGNEAWYYCKDNFRFRGTSQSASCCADGEWKFFSNNLGICSPTLL